MNLINLSLSLNGYNIAGAKRKLADLSTLVETDYAGFIAKQKSEILNYHLKHNSFYKNHLGKSTLEWDALPVLTKSDLQQPLQNRMSTGFLSKKVHIHKTSGSSGDPFIFAKDKFAHALTWASVQDLYQSHGIASNSYEARFYGIPKTNLAHYRERLKDVMSHRYRFSVFDASHANFEAFIRRFKAKPFGHLNGYTSTLVLFAKYLKETGQCLKTICPTLTHCIVTAEMLFQEDLELLETNFGVPVLNEYGTSETGIIALGKGGEALAIDARLLFVEILDEDNTVLPAGEIGKIVVTALFNKAHPFIRYEVGDLGVIDYKNNLPVLTRLEGRKGDYALLPDGKKVPALAFYYVTKEIISDCGNVKEFCIIQNTPDSFCIQYVADKPFTEAQINTIKNAMSHYLGENLSIAFEQHHHLDRSKRGKLKQFTRTF